MLVFKFVGMVWPFERRSVLDLSRCWLTVAGAACLGCQSARRPQTANDVTVHNGETAGLDAGFPYHRTSAAYVNRFCNA
jgi:hypothetical protein